MKAFLQFLKTQAIASAQSLKLIVQSRTVQSCAAGLAVQFAVKKGWLPDNFYTSLVETVTYIFAAIFRVAASANINPANPNQTLK